jgi:predicted PurR-regulated permease PerM
MTQDSSSDKASSPADGPRDASDSPILLSDTAADEGAAARAVLRSEADDHAVLSDPRSEPPGGRREQDERSEDGARRPEGERAEPLNPRSEDGARRPEGERAEPLHTEPSNTDPVGLKQRLGKLATGAIAAATQPAASPRGLRSWLKKYRLLLVVFTILIVMSITFRQVLKPFIFACIIVYLMEPIVSRVTRGRSGGRGVPRWVAVIGVYLSTIGLLAVTLVWGAPRFVSELVRFGETVPADVHTFRTEQLPQLNERLQSVVQTYLPASMLEGNNAEAAPQQPDMEVLKATVHQSRQLARQTAWAQAEARRRVHLAAQVQVRWDVVGEPGFGERIYVGELDEAAQQKLALRRPLPEEGGEGWRFVGVESLPALKLVPTRGGGFEVHLGDADLEMTRVGDGVWRVRKVIGPQIVEEEPQPQVGGGRGERVDVGKLVDLERGLDEAIEELTHSSTSSLNVVLELGRGLVVGIIQGFLALLMTLMVGAFISIDLERVMAFFRGLVPSEHRKGYDELLRRMDRGLSGVVRGQLMICMVNGVLTYIGLVLLKIKFSLLLAVVAALLSVIPIFGTILSTVPIVLFGLTDGLTSGVLALGWIMLVHFLEANILNPKIIGTSAHIHPVIVIFALLAGESAFGLMGALLAVPTASILLTLFQFFLIPDEAEGEQDGG